MPKGIAKAYIKKLVLNHNFTQSQKQTRTERHPRRRDHNDWKFILITRTYTRKSQYKIYFLYWKHFKQTSL